MVEKNIAIAFFFGLFTTMKPVVSEQGPLTPSFQKRKPINLEIHIRWLSMACEWIAEMYHNNNRFEDTVQSATLKESALQNWESILRRSFLGNKQTLWSGLKWAWADHQCDHPNPDQHQHIGRNIVCTVLLPARFREARRLAGQRRWSCLSVVRKGSLDGPSFVCKWSSGDVLRISYLISLHPLLFSCWETGVL